MDSNLEKRVSRVSFELLEWFCWRNQCCALPPKILKFSSGFIEQSQSIWIDFRILSRWKDFRVYRKDSPKKNAPIFVAKSPLPSFKNHFSIITKNISKIFKKLKTIKKKKTKPKFTKKKFFLISRRKNKLKNVFSECFKTLCKLLILCNKIDTINTQRSSLFL